MLTREEPRNPRALLSESPCSAWNSEQVQPGEAGSHTVAALRLEVPFDPGALRWSCERLLAIQEDTARSRALSRVAVLQGFARDLERPLASLLAGVAAPTRR